MLVEQMLSVPPRGSAFFPGHPPATTHTSPQGDAMDFRVVMTRLVG